MPRPLYFISCNIPVINELPGKIRNHPVTLFTQSQRIFGLFSISYIYKCTVIIKNLPIRVFNRNSIYVSPDPGAIPFHKFNYMIKGMPFIRKSPYKKLPVILINIMLGCYIFYFLYHLFRRFISSDFRKRAVYHFITPFRQALINPHSRILKNLPVPGLTLPE